jgi:hypothetical protein
VCVAAPPPRGGRPTTEPTEQVIQDLHRSLVTTARTCEQVLFAEGFDARWALARLPTLLDALSTRIARAVAAIEAERPH